MGLCIRPVLSYLNPFINFYLQLMKDSEKVGVPTRSPTVTMPESWKPVLLVLYLNTLNKSLKIFES